MPQDLPVFEIRAKLADLGLNTFWEGEHITLVLTSKDSKGFTKSK